MPANHWTRRHLAMLDRGLLFVHFARNDSGEFTGWIWHEGGAINGCHQPRTWVEGFESMNEAWVRSAIENAWPGVVYRQVVPYPSETLETIR